MSSVFVWNCENKYLVDSNRLKKMQFILDAHVNIAFDYAVFVLVFVFVCIYPQYCEKQ